MTRIIGKSAAALLLALLILLPAVSCAGGLPAEVTLQTETGTEPDTAPDQTLPGGIVICSDGECLFKVVRPDICSQTGIDAAVELKRGIEKGTASKVTIETDYVKGVKGDMKVSVDAPEILVGMTNRQETADVMGELPADSFAVCARGNKLVIVGTDDKATLDAVRWFVGEYLSDVPEAASGFLLPEGFSYISERATPPYKLSEDADSALSGFVLKSEKRSEAADGIEYVEQIYTDSSGQPVRAFAAVIQRGRGRFYTGTPEDGTVLENMCATVTAEMEAAAKSGRRGILAVNAGFFDMNGDKQPRGLCVKEGELLRPTASYPFFAVLDDGSPVIGTAGEYAKYSGGIRNAVGGRYLLMRDGKPFELGLGSDAGTERHPRTGVGYREDGTVVLIVVDGRQSGYSMGATFADMCLLFKDFGCTEALNLDGGGSSTFVLADPATGKFVTKNRPSGGTMRKIADSLIVLPPD